MDNLCPVPKSQQPLEEFSQLYNSWFFSLPTKHQTSLNRSLIASWLTIFPICLFISYGSFALRENIKDLIMISGICSFGMPILILIRQSLGWNYILNRLLDERIEYEETGWYDGQTWEKPIEWLQQDLIVAQYEVKPITRRIYRSLAITIGLFISSIFLCSHTIII